MGVVRRLSADRGAQVSGFVFTPGLWHSTCVFVDVSDEREGAERNGRRSFLIEDAARLLGVSRRTVYYRIREGRLRTIRTRCGSQRVLLSSIEELRGGASEAG